MDLYYLHGFLGHPADWDEVIKKIPGTALTLPGHLDRDLSPLILPPGKKGLVGYSAGGRLALQLKEKYPEEIAFVVAFSTHPGLHTKRDERRAADEKWIQLLETDFSLFLEKWYAQELFAGNLPNLEKRRCHDPKKLAAFLKTYGTGTLAPPKLYPETYFAFGERDLRYKNLYRKLTAQEIPNAGHMVHLENPTFCAKMIEGALHDHTCGHLARS